MIKIFLFKTFLSLNKLQFELVFNLQRMFIKYLRAFLAIVERSISIVQFRHVTLH